MENLEFIKSLTQEEVFETWRKGEENIEHWKTFWESKGYKSWEEWRRTTHKTLFEKPLKWGLYTVSDPLITIPEWRGGMFHSWNKWFYVNFPEKPPKLKDLLTHPGVQNHWYVREIAHNFKDVETTLMATRLLNDTINIAEGIHRACAITLMAHEKINLNAKILVMLADWPNQEPPKLGNWDNK
ncbi:MAG: hypothetical protein A2735_01530 [Candidatus Yanofskybacteria bacterium RIFCSPHIGHO2_01_FULL_41_21]|uniref:Uncharacterized protein n=1 Tax=Candidatus Yanofskybacteria bacterium RIFCSPHIGHO2_01_FULL_41_21 TaxID=1802660 RepID=A0A1F8E9Z7_9BACT|nr:MAG: hypothetical protein A2735_01530 [Candidatus Yanofskybacteria bacterium RIFCSPHIGHO2_01_FULL_41_21]